MKNTEQLVNEILSPPKKKAANIPIEKLHTFNGHPFKVLDNEEMEILIECYASERTQKAGAGCGTRYKENRRNRQAD